MIPFTQHTITNRQHFRMLSILFLILSYTLSSFSQDTIRIKKKREYYDDCYFVLRYKGKEFKDTIPLALFNSDAKIELVMHKECEAGKTNDIFVSSFQLEILKNGVLNQIACVSSFFTDNQKKAIRSLKEGNAIHLTSIQVHAPDGFRKAKDLEIFLN